MHAPFALIEDLEHGHARLLREADEILCPAGPDLAKALAAMSGLSRAGTLAGWIGYDAGHWLEDRLAPLRRDHGERLMWMARFADETIMASDAVDGWLAEAASGDGQLGEMRPAISQAEYLARFAVVTEAIRAGDIYQANLTFPLTGSWQGDPLSIYRALRPRAAARFGAVIFDGADWLLSFSPELFFRADGRHIETRPMKGTRPRGVSEAQDAAQLEDLERSAKDRAENLMITDLMRNDLSRIAEPGSVRVSEPFRIERYPTVFQMTSTVTGELAAPFDPAVAIGSLFPCGSITGAPKLRAMEILAEVEGWRRGPYCGAIGMVSGDHAQFNVAIRTLWLKADGSATFGIGSGVVADSDGPGEWRECMDKARFLFG